MQFCHPGTIITMQYIQLPHIPPTKSTPGIFNNCNCFFPFRILYSIVLKSERRTDDTSLRNFSLAKAVVVVVVVVVVVALVLVDDNERS